MELTPEVTKALQEVESQYKIFRLAVWDGIAATLRENPTKVYADVAKQHGVSLATVTRVAKLNNIVRHGKKEKNNEEI
jgi:uncharacterized protein YerC